MGGYFYVSWLLSKVLCGLCVPTFFLISGFLFFYRSDFTKSLYISKIKKRFVSIAIPFILWNIIYMLIWAIGGLSIIRNDEGEIIGSVPYLTASFGNILRDTYHCVVGLFLKFNGSGSPCDIPFWYLRDLVCMFILSPFVFWFSKYSKIYGLILLGIAWIMLGKYATFPFGILGFNMRPAVLFYIMGAFFSVNKKNMVEQLTRIGSWIYSLYVVVALIDLLSVNMECNSYIHRLTILIGIIVVFKIGLMVVVYRKEIESPFLNKVKRTNFFIYASHWMILYFLAIPLGKLATGTPDVFMVLLYILQIVLCCIICIAAGLLLNRYFPKTMKVLNGR